MPLPFYPNTSKESFHQNSEITLDDESLSNHHDQMERPRIADFKFHNRGPNQDLHDMFNCTARKNPRSSSKPSCPHPAVYNRLMKSLGRVGNTDEVIRVFRKMKEDYRMKPNVLCYNTLLNSLVIANRFEEALSFFDEMDASGVTPNVSTYNILVKAHSCYSNWPNRFESACEIIKSMWRSGCLPDAVTFSTLITGLSRAGRIDEAYSVLDWMIDENCRPNVYTYTPILHSLCEKGRLEEAKKLIEFMVKNGCLPNTVTYNIWISGLCKNEKFDEVEKILKESGKCGWKPNAITYNIYLNGLFKAGRRTEAYKQIEVMRENGL